MKNKEKKVVYYNDLVNDDFAENPTKHYRISDKFKYIHKNIFYRFFSFILYHVIAKPIFFLILKIKYHVRVKNRKAIRQLRATGFFVYSNHTQNIIDAFINHTMLFHRKGHIIANNDVYSLKGLRTIVNMLGTMPIPNDMIQSKKFYDAVSYYIKKKHIIVVFPEAHVWPYYNDIRPFPSTSFIFPVTLNKPIIVSTITYRQRKIFKNAHPYITIHVSNPIFPKLGVPVKDNQAYLSDVTYCLMKKHVKEANSYEYIHYEQKNNDKK
ncbi:MAG: 1-acyl-sn-glycerol-3-phosphate acyltransferase [Bacilli bacterium]|nr:1-acyl-sn-glycerol-3-phosphate acyltransferase [Bacilli bacterium]